MPEGHPIHRHAREQHAAPAGQVLAVSSPQGRIDTGPLLQVMGICRVVAGRLGA